MVAQYATIGLINPYILAPILKKRHDDAVQTWAILSDAPSLSIDGGMRMAELSDLYGWKKQP